MTEIWKDVVGYEGHYAVSNLGRVYSHKGTGRILVQTLNSNGYPQLTLWLDGVRGAYAVHVLVTRAFIGPRPDKLDVRHLDGEHTNNVLTNLEYSTRSRNTQDRKWHKGTSIYKLRPSDVQQIKRRLGHEAGRALAREFGVSPVIISRIKLGKLHKDVLP